MNTQAVEKDQDSHPESKDRSVTTVHSADALAMIEHGGHMIPRDALKRPLPSLSSLLRLAWPETGTSQSIPR